MLVTSVILLCALPTGWWPVDDLLIIFRTPLLWSGLTAVIILAVSQKWRKHRWRALIITGSFIAIAIATINAPALEALPGCSGDGNAPRLRIVSTNLWAGNRDPAATLAWITAQQPDVVVLLEARDNARPIVAALARTMPYHVACHRRAPCSTMILSRIRPITVLSLAAGDAENRRALSAAVMTLSSGGELVDIIGVHLSRPWPPGRQRTELTQLSRYLAVHPQRRVVVAGDFNATPETQIMQDFGVENGLRRVAIDGGTWPIWRSSGIPAVLAIDHLLAGQGLSARDANASPAIGSDHRGISATFCLTPTGLDQG